MSDPVQSHPFSPPERRRGRDTPMSITGAGAVTGYGWGRKHVWDGFLLGESAVKPAPWLADYLDSPPYLSVITGTGDQKDGPSRFSQALRFSGREAITDARERGWQPGPVVGVIHSVALGDVETFRDYYRHEGDFAGTRRKLRSWLQMIPSTVIAMFMKEFDFHGPAMSVSATCASSNVGMITAKSWIDSGIASDVVLLATDLSGIAENLPWFRDLGAAVLDLPPFDGCRPFQEGSRGFVGGEASVAMVLSGRPAGGYAAVLGGAMTNDGYHAIALAPDHNEVFRCFNEATANSGVDPAEVAYLNAHGPGTAQCDAAEAQVLDELYPDAKGIFSIKPLVGHCQAAAGAAEMLATLYAFETGYVPAPPQVAPGHPRLVDGLTRREPGLILKSSLGMGGHNAVLVVDGPQE
jgi:3-oxoacyl-[acyl-carrier-protein] synthase II